ncbi:MAG: transaldolase, partial [Candidatus Omnitrophota bacterium]
MKTKTGQNTLIALAKRGQSPWYDNIDRRFIENGELKKLFDNGILGVTSNPTIFEKAVSASDVYDSMIKKLASGGKTALQIYDTLTLEDVSMAADLLRDTYEKTEHLNGYVSIEVLPELAHNPTETVKAARAIFKRINKPNILIKVPGTKEAPEAVRALTKEGVNVNVTLLFSVKHYETCARAYIDGLQDRNVFSVASVFVSRVDTKLDKIFEEKKIDELKGKIAVANAKMIYRKFKELDFKGGNIQRVLWASTSTKNPSYSDVKYVEELIGTETVNTMPPQTVDAFLDHGRVEVTIEKDLDKARSCLAKLKSLGIDIDETCQEIQD